MITLRYTINGAKFTRRFERREWRDAVIRARVLRENGVAVTINRKRV